MLDELLHEHEVLREQARGLGALISHPWPPRREELHRARAQMMTSVSEHVLFETGLAAELAATDPRLTPVRERLDKAGRRWLEDYLEHGRRWTPGEVESDWLGYRAAERALLARLCDHLVREELEFYEPLQLRENAN